MRVRSSFLPSVAMVLFGVAVAWVTVAPAAVDSNSLIGGFCIDNKECASQFTANCLGWNCPSGTTHEECQGDIENNPKTCNNSGKNCKDTTGCDDHADCTCS
jgi:hypothetical protein